MRQQENLQLGIPLETARRFPRRLQELCGYSVYQGTIRAHRQSRSDRTSGPRARQAHGVGSDRRPKGAHGEARSEAANMRRGMDQILRNRRYGGMAAFALGFASISRHGVVGPWQAPVVGPLRGPGEIRRPREMRQRPGAVIGDIADEAKFALRSEHPRHGGDGRVLHEAPLPVPPLRPRIGMDQVDPRQRMRRRPCQQFGGIAREQPDVADAVGFDLRQDLGHAVDIGLAADEAGARKGARFRDQMLAAAESDFEPDVVDRRRRTGRRDRAGAGSPMSSASRGSRCSIRSA